MVITIDTYQLVINLQFGPLRLQLLICHKTSKVDGSNEAPVVASEPTKVEQEDMGVEGTH